MKPPSRAQLRYLKNLGYTGPEPATIAEASVAIEELLAGGDSAAARRAIVNERRLVREDERREEEEDERQGALDDLEDERQLQHDLAAIDSEYRRSTRAGCAPIGCIGSLILAPFQLAIWVVSAPFRLLASMIGGGASVAGRVAAVSGKGSVAASRAGSVFVEESVAPWMRAQDWKGMADRAAGFFGGACSRAWSVAASMARSADRGLSRIAGNDPSFLWVVRLTAIAAAAGLLAGLLIWFF